MGKILVVDDEQSMREFLAICLRRSKYEVVVADSGKAALDKLRDHAFDLVITDLKMPGEVDGLGLLKLIKGGGVRRALVPGTTPVAVDPEVILLTAFATTETAIAAM
ncbi:MAG: response regulator, partial [Proteobacteria bacterium]|nr:response regulator [Pseudomonadota bacterium]